MKYLVRDIGPIEKIERESVRGKEKKELSKNYPLRFYKKIGLLAFIFLFTIGQVALLSAFEAHIINVTAYICAPSETRTMGFWKNHPNVYANCLPQFLGDYSEDFWVNNEDDVNAIFDAANAKDMRDMLKGQLLAMKFNICAFGIEADEGEEFGGYTLNELVRWADDLLRDPNSLREDQEFAKNLLDGANNLEYIKYCSTEPSWLALALAEKPKKDKGPKDKNLTSTEDSEILLTEGELPEEEQVLGEATSTEEVLAEEEPPAEEPPAEEPPVEEEPLAEELPTEEEESPSEEPSAEEEPVEESSSEEPPAEEELPAE